MINRYKKYFYNILKSQLSSNNLENINFLYTSLILLDNKFKKPYVSEICDIVNFNRNYFIDKNYYNEELLNILNKYIKDELRFSNNKTQVLFCYLNLLIINLSSAKITYKLVIEEDLEYVNYINNWVDKDDILFYLNSHLLDNKATIKQLLNNLIFGKSKEIQYKLILPLNFQEKLQLIKLLIQIKFIAHDSKLLFINYTDQEFKNLLNKHNKKEFYEKLNLVTSKKLDPLILNLIRNWLNKDDKTITLTIDLVKLFFDLNNNFDSLGLIKDELEYFEDLIDDFKLKNNN